MPLLNYQTKIWTQNTRTTIQGPKGEKKIKTKKPRTLTKRTKEIVRNFFLSGQKGIYHRIEFCQVFATLTNKSICEASARVYCQPAPSDQQSQQNILIDSKNSFQASVDTLKHTHTNRRWKQ